MFHVENDGPEIIRTNYWQSEHAAKGFLFLSINAGCFRLLVPPSMEAEIPEMLRGARAVVVSRGPWVAQGGRDAYEVLFEDGTDEPYALHLAAEQCDRLPSSGDRHKTFRFALWTAAGKRAELPAHYRIVKRLPWLKPWRPAH